MTRRGALMRGDRRRGFHRCDAVLHRVLHLLERAHLDLAHALARDAEFFGELLERDRILGEPARLEDAPLAVVEHAQRLAERLAAVAGVLGLGRHPLPALRAPVPPDPRLPTLAGPP